MPRLAGLLFALALSGCAATAGGGTPAPLEDTPWVLVSLHGNPVGTATTPGLARPPDLTLRSTGQRAAAFGGCNRLMGSYRRDGAALAIERLVSTRMACPATMAVESSYVAALQAVTRWRMAGNRLQLLDSAQAVVAEFEPGPAR